MSDGIKTALYGEKGSKKRFNRALESLIITSSGSIATAGVAIEEFLNGNTDTAVLFGGASASLGASSIKFYKTVLDNLEDLRIEDEPNSVSDYIPEENRIEDLSYRERRYTRINL